MSLLPKDLVFPPNDYQAGRSVVFVVGEGMRLAVCGVEATLPTLTILCFNPDTHTHIQGFLYACCLCYSIMFLSYHLGASVKECSYYTQLVL